MFNAEVFKTPEPPGINEILIDSVIVALSDKDLLKLCTNISDNKAVSAFVKPVLTRGASDSVAVSAKGKEVNKTADSDRVEYQKH